jgi:hypothetical protein
MNLHAINPPVDGIVDPLKSKPISLEPLDMHNIIPSIPALQGDAQSTEGFRRKVGLQFGFVRKHRRVRRSLGLVYPEIGVDRMGYEAAEATFRAARENGGEQLVSDGVRLRRRRGIIYFAD